MQCSECLFSVVTTQEEGYHPHVPSISRHSCDSKPCRAVWFTCNQKCRSAKGGEKGRYNQVYKNFKSAKRHHVQYHVQDVPGGWGLPLSRGSGVDPTNDGDVLDPVILESPLESPHNDLDAVLLESPLDPEILFRDLNDSDPTLTDRIIMEDDSHFEFVNAGDGELVVDNNDNDLFYRDLPIVPEVEQPTYLESRILTKPVELFKSHMVAGNPLLAASVVVTQALLQTSLVTVTPLPVANVKLFLYLAKLVISTGKLQQGNLSKVLQIICPYAEKCETSWAPLPCTVPGFTSRLTNVTNSNPLLSILPIPPP